LLSRASRRLGENYDLIIGVDGNRVTNFMDFHDQLREAQPGETVYLNILRGGKRLQLPVEMPQPNAEKLSPVELLRRRGEAVAAAVAAAWPLVSFWRALVSISDKVK
jgi:predicted metalloprotease with PDZ domain